MKKSVRIISIIIAILLVAASSGCSAFSGKLDAKVVKVDNSDFFNKYYSDQEKYAYLVSGFNSISEDVLLNHYLHRFNYWIGVKLCVQAVNKNNFDITVVGLEVGNNGCKETTLSNTPRAVVDIKAGTSEPQNIWFDSFADGSTYTNEEICDIIVKEMPLKLIYVKAESGIRTLDDASESDLIYEKVK